MFESSKYFIKNVEILKNSRLQEAEVKKNFLKF